ncbi:hypothetical protein C8J56DRAFT_1173207 [Mycena floridula]|nr:hypothetical protein C8J56DRAFT_1173207 [Mycena floridula]
MPRRAVPQLVTDVAGARSSPFPSSSSLPSNLTILRTHWKWAAFSQFFFTFSQLFAMDDVPLSDIEDDLVHGTSIFLPRIMQRLLFILSYDRKVSPDNWQTALRKQYYKRGPFANPIGPEPSLSPKDERQNSVPGEYTTPDPHPEMTAEDDSTVPNPDSTPAPDSTRDNSMLPEDTKADQDDLPPRPPKPRMFQHLTDAQVAELEQQESRNWLDLTMLEKLDSIHLLTEWQFHNPTRVRTLMRDDDEGALWRIEPIGYDAKLNAYWLIGANRLWIQRELPKPPKPAALKRKRPDAKKPNAKSSRASVSKRQKTEAVSTTKPAAAKGKGKAPAIAGRNGRAAKAQAKIKLDAQAKELAFLNREAAARAREQNGIRSSHRGKTSIAVPPKPLGVRLSARLRGEEDEEWQAVPDEWLDGELSSRKPQKTKASSSKSVPKKTGLEDDAVSDLTELSEDSEERDLDGKESETSEAEDEDEAEPEPELEPEEVEKPEVEQKPEDFSIPEGFVEWETICVTLYEWEHIAERWQAATHYAEKALYKALTKTIVPIITEELREIERKRRLEDAVVQRKRSSRIAVKENAKEEARLAMKRKEEEAERMGRARRAEARQMKDEAERQRRELIREQRRLAQESEDGPKKNEPDGEEMDVDVVGAESVAEPVKRQEPQTIPVPPPISTNGSTSGTRTPKGEEWELDCEICHRKGMNIDEDVGIMCCEMCSKWQHMSCHDQADDQAGRPRRNWELVEFLCRECRLRKAASGYHQPQSSQNPYLALRVPPASGSHNPYMSSPGSHPGKSYPAPVSDLRSAPPAVKPIAFSHYQPHQRGFASTPQGHYGSNTMNGHYSQETSVQGWNPTIANQNAYPVSSYVSHGSGPYSNGSGQSHMYYASTPSS